MSLTFIKNFLLIIASVILFLFAINLMGAGFSKLGNEVVASIIYATSNPYVGLFIGLLTTAIIQSSSTTTSMAVAAVASGSISFENAIPIIMGANIGTTITSSIVSLAYLTKKNEFKKAISAGMVHDIFNFATVLIIFPLELKYNLLSNLSRSISSLFYSDQVLTLPLLRDFLNRDLFDWVMPTVIESIDSGIILLMIAFLILFGCIKLISNFIYKRLIGKYRTNLENFVFNNKYRSFSWGLLITSAVQSSSLTSSLIVPLVATGKVPLLKAFPFVMGANIGTTITALLAALFRTEGAINLAIAHFLFNLIGVLIFLPFPFLNKIPPLVANNLGHLTLRYRFIGLLYIIVTFFLLPFTLIYINKEGKVKTHQESTSHLKKED